MTCIIKAEDTTVVFKKGANGAPGYWLVGGRYKVSDLSECKFVPSAQDRKIVVHTQTVAPAPLEAAVEPSAPPAAAVQTPQVAQGIGVAMDSANVSEVQTIMSLAGDSVWGGIAILALVMVFKFMNKKLEMEQKSQSDLSQQCTSRHSDATGKLDAISQQVTDLDKRMSSIELELRYSFDPRDRDRDRDRDRGDPRRSPPPAQHPQGSQR